MLKLYDATQTLSSTMAMVTTHTQARSFFMCSFTFRESQKTKHSFDEKMREKPFYILYTER